MIKHKTNTDQWKKEVTISIDITLDADMWVSTFEKIKTYNLLEYQSKNMLLKTEISLICSVKVTICNLRTVSKPDVQTFTTPKGILAIIPFYKITSCLQCLENHKTWRTKFENSNY